MKHVLKKACFFGFTGTPISKTGRDTYKEFSLPTERYLDRYFITDSVADGFTLKIAYQPRLEEKFGLKKEQLEYFVDSEYDEIPEDVREEVKGDVGQRLNTIKTILENKERIKVLGLRNIAKDFKDNVDGRFKAMIVAASRKACVRYKTELDKLLPPECSEIVMTFEDRESDDELRDDLLKLKSQHRGQEIEKVMEDITTKFVEIRTTPKS